MTLEDKSQEANQLSNELDSDSQSLMIDDGASACITNHKADFVDEPLKISRKVKEIKGHARAMHRGAVQWMIEEDDGLVHALMIQGAYLVPEVTTKIMSQQHLVQQMHGNSPNSEGMGSIMTSKSVTLFWNQQKYYKTVPLDPKLNGGMTITAPGTKSHKCFRSKIVKPDTNQVNIFKAHVIPPEEDEDDKSLQPKDLVQQPTETQDPKVPQEALSQTKPFVMTDLMSHVIPEDKEPTSMDPQDKLWHYHY